MTQLAEMFQTNPVSSGQASALAGMGVICVEGHEPMPRCHMAVQHGPDGAMEEIKVIMTPAQWADMVGKMIEYAYHIGGDYAELLRAKLNQQQPRFN